MTGSQLKVTRRSFLKGGAAVVGATAVGNAVEFTHPKEAFADDAPIEKRVTYCDMCNHVPKCGIVADVQDEKIVRIQARGKYPASPICAKGIASLQELYDPDRLLTPMVRTNEKGSGDPQWEPISWDDAYARIATELNRVKDTYGPEKVLFYAGDPKEPRGAMQRVATLFGSPNYGAESSTCAAASWITSQLVTGQLSMGTDPSDATESALVWTLNPAWSQPYRFGQMMKHKERGCKFVIVDPRITPTVTGLADIHLQPRPGTDGALALGFINIMIRDNMYDKEFVDEWAVGFDELAEYAKEFTPEKVEEITWVPADKLEAAVKLIWENAPSTLVTSSAGACHSTNVGNFQRAVFSIIAMMGSLDVPGGLGMGPGLPFDYTATTAPFRLEKMYEEKGLQDIRADKDDFPVWAHFNKMIQVNMLPELVKNGEIKAGVLLGANAMMWPQTPEYQKAIQDMEFSVAIDYYMRPWTHDFVDMILPAAMCYERMAPFAVFGRKIYHRDPVVAPAGECREDWRILLEIGCALGFEEECFGGDVEAAMEDMLAGVDLGVTMADLRAAAAEGYEVPGGNKDTKKYETGGLRKDGEPGFNTKTGKIELVSELLKDYKFDGLPTYEEPVYSPVSTPDVAKEYSLILNSGSRVPYYTHSKLRDLPWLNQFMPEPVVRIHPDDAEARGIEDGDRVKVFNQFGEIEMLAETTNIVLPGVTDIFHGWHQADINLLTTRDFDPITGFPPFRSGLCEVKKA